MKCQTSLFSFIWEDGDHERGFSWSPSASPDKC